MKKVLYLTNIEVPYRVRFFNELAKYCDLTVLYERERSASRNQAWANSVQRNFRFKYLNGLNIGNESSFSLKSEQEIAEHRLSSGKDRNDTILVVGQYLDCKGMDVALEAARLDQSLRYKFVGMGSRTALFQQRHEIPENVELIPFLQKQELEEEYKTCAMLVLPTRQECWGLVINEAASFGMPIVSTWGSGAAVEFLSKEYPHYLAEPGNAESLYECIALVRNDPQKANYSTYLLERTRKYSIENNVREHVRAFGIENMA